MLLLCQILHHQVESLVKNPPLEDLQALASMADKYDCCAVISLQADIWMDRLTYGEDYSLTSLLKASPEVIMTWLKLARLLDLQGHFSRLSSILAVKYAGSFLELKQNLDFDGVFADYFYSKPLLSAFHSTSCLNHAPSTT